MQEQKSLQKRTSTPTWHYVTANVHHLAIQPLFAHPINDDHTSRHWLPPDRMRPNQCLGSVICASGLARQSETYRVCKGFQAHQAYTWPSSNCGCD